MDDGRYEQYEQPTYRIVTMAFDWVVNVILLHAFS